MEIAEFDAENPVRTHEHTEDDEQGQHRDADFVGKFVRNDTGDENQGTN